MIRNAKFTAVLLSFGLALGLAGCAGGYGAAHPNVMNNVGHTASWDEFGYCGGWGCSDRQTANFTADEWRQVEEVFAVPATSAEQERQQIAQSIGVIENIAGAKTGYDNDRGGTGAGIFHRGQLDCYSEAANTSTFLHLLDNAGLIRFHTVSDPIMRGQAASKSFRPTHATAAITENESGTLIAMDSWFYDNGHAAVYVDADTWADGWGPDDGGAMF